MTLEMNQPSDSSPRPLASSSSWTDLDLLKAEVLQELKRFRQRRVMVVGDLGLDEYVSGDVRRISPEAPVPVLEVSGEDQRLGLSGNVAQNIASLGGDCVLLSVVGADPAAGRVRELLSAAGVSPNGLIVDRTRPTTRKLRVLAGQHHLVRVDFEHKRYLSAEVAGQLISQAERELSSCDALILQDYAKGVLSEACLQELTGIAKRQGKRVLLDPHRSTPLSHYRGVDLLTPNYEEALALAGIDSDAFADAESLLRQISGHLRAVTGAEQLVITRGKFGMRLFTASNEIDLPTYARQVFDVTGAGDTVIATLALAWLSDLSLGHACVAANAAAGVVVGKVGCVPCSLTELQDYLASV